MERLVEIQHPGYFKTYWFLAPESLGEIEKGDLVLCDTKLGDQVGRVVSDPIIAENVSDIAVRLGATLPIKSIKQVCGKILHDYIYSNAKWNVYYTVTSAASRMIYELDEDKNNIQTRVGI